MNVAIKYFIFILYTWLFGVLLDILGLYLSIKYASRKDIKKSRICYGIMIVGEKIESLVYKCAIFIPMYLIAITI